MENIRKSKNITNDTKNILETTALNTVLYGCETWTYNKMITDKLRHLRCTVTEGSYVSVGQSKKQTVKYVKNSELKRICYKEPFRGNSDCLVTYAGWRATGS